MIGARVKARLEEIGMTQSELARRVKLTQPAINALIRGSSRTSLHLHRIAQVLGTSTAYLEGEIEDPSEDAPPPAVAVPSAQIMMPVTLPPRDALVQMFVGLLASIATDADRLEQAELLAERLPTALARVSNLRREPRGNIAADAEIFPKRHREHQE